MRPLTPGQYVDRLRAIRARQDEDIADACATATTAVLARNQARAMRLFQRVPEADREAATRMVVAALGDEQ